MPSNRELPICDNMRKIFSTMIKISMIFLVCFAGNDNENRKHLFIEIYGRCRPYKLSVQCRPYKKNPMLKEFGLYNRNCTCTLVNFGLF